MVVPVSTEVSQKRDTFFRFIWGDAEGYVCFARLERGKKVFDEDFFKYPDELPQMLEFVNRFTPSHDVYFCPQILDRRKRAKEHVAICPNAWADLDSCEPEHLLVAPSVVLETSPGRFQALWVFESPIDPGQAEDISRRIAYKHLDEGADKSGWDLTQLLRVPLTYNHKYGTVGTIAPTVKIIKVNSEKHQPDDFEDYPEAEGLEYLSVPMPTELELPAVSAEDILQEFRVHLKPLAIRLFTERPTDDWSKALWNLQMLLFEAGLTKEQVFIVAKAAACNKYSRDGKSDTLLWKEILRAAATNEGNLKAGQFVVQTKPLKPLLTDEERAHIEATPTLVEEYIEWASTMGDAAWQYHQVGAFVILSSLLAGTVRLPTSYGTVIPNLWFMILADTTLTRKTTAMDMAMDMLLEVDSDCILATDGSIEGLMTSLSMRPGRPSIFLRDEFSGLLEAMTKKDYYAGMAETLTKLYDGKYQKRILRKEVIEVRDPILIFFAGGIKTRILSLLNYEHVASGFMPRFVFVTAESDVTRLRPLGPPTEQSLGERNRLIEEFRRIHNHYARSINVEVGGKVAVVEKQWQAKLTPEAWLRYNDIETLMLETGLDAEQRDLMTPTMDRLAKSGLKAAVLLSACRKQDDIDVVVEEQDVIRAFYYVEQWRHHTLEIVNNLGKSTQERSIEQILRAIKRTPGVHRAMLMRHYHLDARSAEMIFGTLEQRGLISRVRSGRTERLYPTEA